MSDAVESGCGFIRRDRGWHPPALAPDYQSSRLRAPQRGLLSLPTTLSEETGPVFGHASTGAHDADLIHNYAAPGASALGPRILVHGQLRDQSGRGLPRALIEVWQANARGGGGDIATRMKVIRRRSIRISVAVGVA